MGQSATERHLHDQYVATLARIEAASVTLRATISRARRSQEQRANLVGLHNLVRGMGMDLNRALGGRQLPSDASTDPSSGGDTGGE
ncbi:hypothetical protein [Plantactinospora sp. CA-290183]|uniref:hypothetical protein n=1 Tax=Plantactinospora sp. CA-290183 TaxID=3240006 RepID=UPI003D8EE112